MIYKNFKGLKLSALGLGCMRFPLFGPDTVDVDLKATSKIVDYAIINGINYFDTAWAYHGGTSESIIGQMLKKYPRNSYYLASKFPGFKEEMMADPKAIFEKQLEKCCVDYFDFYLCHNVCERNIGWLTDGEYNVVEYLIKQKREGKIRFLGFSTHGSRSVIRRFLDKFGKELDFCQIQLNYFDWIFQSAKEKVELLNNYNIPIWVMEPVRGGKLATLEDQYIKKICMLRPNVSAPEWAFRFLQSIPGVTMILSGMSNMDQVRDNIQTFTEEKPLDKNEMRTLMAISKEMIAGNSVPCTACGYCLDRCPKNLPIPDLIKSYNEETLPKKEDPSFCIGCKSCESLCPQGIQISDIMARFSQRLKGE